MKHPDDCLGCAINRIVRKLAKEHSGVREPKSLRKFGHAVALGVRREMERLERDR